jgi:hypothetical protein
MIELKKSQDNSIFNKGALYPGLASYKKTMISTENKFVKTENISHPIMEYIHKQKEKEQEHKKYLKKKKIKYLINGIRTTFTVLILSGIVSIYHSKTVELNDLVLASSIEMATGESSIAKAQADLNINDQSLSIRSKLIPHLVNRKIEIQGNDLNKNECHELNESFTRKYPGDKDDQKDSVHVNMNNIDINNLKELNDNLCSMHNNYTFNLNKN